MTKAEIFEAIKQKQSYLCVGLDTDIQKLPASVRKEANPTLVFNKRIIDATIDMAVAYKPNIAFYESQGAAGWETLEKTLEYIPKSVFTIADAKRGDIGNTSALYARAFFENMDFDAITIAPYMGQDSVTPFLEFKGKWAILLALTSNIGALDFQNLRIGENRLFEEVLRKSSKWGTDEQMMYVVGATRGDQFADIRKHIPEHFLLVPGVGAQGGDLEAVSKHGMNAECGLLVNSSRGIIYASQEADFEQAAKKAAYGVQQEMAGYLEKYLPK
jgi:orotidine-5'-phosphate decarboxylase